MNYFILPGLSEPNQKTNINLKMSKICEKFNTNNEQIVSKLRHSNIVEARSIIAYILHKVIGLSSTVTGEYINRDHSTVLHLSKKIEGYMQVDTNYKELVTKFI